MSEFIKKTPFLKMAYITINDNSFRTLLDYNFFFVLRGSLRVRNESQTFFLEAADVILLESGNTYNLSSAGNNIILSITVDRNFFSNGQSLQTGHYTCNSGLDFSRDYTPLRQLLSHIATVYFSKNDIHDLNLISLGYNLLYYLNAYHYEESVLPESINTQDKHKDRLVKILDYIQKNFATGITLQQAADYLQLSSPYLSSFFKQHLQENFNSYVNRIRLEHAVEDLIYSDKSVTAITYDNGFPSMNAFNKLFRETHQTTPNKYRITMKKERLFQSEGKPDAVIELNATEHAYLLQKLDDQAMTFMPNIQFPSQVAVEITDMRKSQIVTPIWKRLINIGPLSQLSKRDIEKQVAQIQAGVGFEYARITNIIDFDIICENPRTGQLLFTSFDRTIDLLSMHQLIPYLDFSFPSKYLDALYEKGQPFDTERYLQTVSKLITHSANMYGPDFMESWYFEVNHYENPITNNHEVLSDFVDRFIRTSALIKKLLPKAKVGGICHDTIFGYDNYSCILKMLQENNVIPDFFNIGIFPYEFIPKEDVLQSTGTLSYTDDPSFALHKTLEFKEIIAAHFQKLPEIHIAFLAPDYFSHNSINDTCFQSTFFFHNTVDLVGNVDMLGYYQMSDITSAPEESNDFLEGRNGLFNKYGIKKPGNLLLELFSHAHDRLVQKGNDYIVLKGQKERYMIGLCNHTYLSDYSRLFIVHEKVSFTDAYSIYENPQTKNISLKLKNLAIGEYDVILHQINKNHGSVLDEWARNEYWDRFSREELEYMRKTLQPLKTHQSKTCTDGTLEFHMQLAPHEVLFITLFYRW